MVYKYALDDTRMPELRNAHKKSITQRQNASWDMITCKKKNIKMKINK